VHSLVTTKIKTETQVTKGNKEDTHETQTKHKFKTLIITLNNNNNNNKVETSRGGKVLILWNQQIQTDGTIPNNKPDIVIRDNEKGTCMLIDVAISRDRNVIQKEAEKSFKYKYLTIEIQRMRDIKKVVPGIIGATGTISKSFRKYVSTIPNNTVFLRDTVCLRNIKNVKIPYIKEKVMMMLMTIIIKIIISNLSVIICLLNIFQTLQTDRKRHGLI
jgi:hypothetical protein